MTVMEASTQLWFFESHNNAKRSQWLQSTLSELEDKTRGMLELIEGDADTFAQRAEMYYKKRPELVNMIEDFYRSYRSLTESYDQLRMESGNSLLNRRFSLTSRSFTNESLASSMVTSDSNSDPEVDDPVQEVECKLKENDDPVQEVESKLKETQVECMVEKSTDNNSEVCIVKPMLEEIRSKENIFTEHYAKAVNKMQINDKKQMVVYLGREETHGESQFKETQVKCMLEKSNENNSEVCVVKPMVQEIRRKKNILIEDHAKGASRMQINDKQEAPIVHGKGETHGDIELAKLIHSEVDFKLSGVSFPKHELEEYPGTKSENCEIKPMIEIKPPIKSSEPSENYVEREVQRLKGEIDTYKVELEQKDGEKREVIRQLSASMDMLKEENDRMKNFIRESKKQGRVFELGKLKDVFCKNRFRFPAPSSREMSIGLSPTVQQALTHYTTTQRLSRFFLAVTSPLQGVNSALLSDQCQSL